MMMTPQQLRSHVRTLCPFANPHSAPVPPYPVASAFCHSIRLPQWTQKTQTRPFCGGTWHTAARLSRGKVDDYVSRRDTYDPYWGNESRHLLRASDHVWRGEGEVDMEDFGSGSGSGSGGGSNGAVTERGGGGVVGGWGGGGSSHFPSARQLKYHFLNAAVPMVGFGWMDNTVMIQAGEMVDTTIGVTFGLSTLTAAAFGQVFSDVSGVCFGGTVEAIANKLGLPQPNFTEEQRGSGAVRLIGTVGRAVGVVVGCVMGMTSLLFMDLEKTELLKRQAELETIFSTVIKSAERLIKANCVLYLRDELNQVWIEYRPVVRPSNATAASSSGSKTPLAQSQSLPLSPSTATSEDIPPAPSPFLALSLPPFPLPSLRWFSLSSLFPFSRSSYSQSAASVEQSSDGKRESAAGGGGGTGILGWRGEGRSKKKGAEGPRQIPFVDTEGGVIEYTYQQKKVGCIKHMDGWMCVCVCVCVQPVIIGQKRWTKERRFQLESSIKSLLCYPVFDDADPSKVIGVIQFSNKRNTDTGETINFKRDDEKLAKMLSEHLSLYVALATHHQHTETDERTDPIINEAWVTPLEDNLFRDPFSSPTAVDARVALSVSSPAAPPSPSAATAATKEAVKELSTKVTQKTRELMNSVKEKVRLPASDLSHPPPMSDGPCVMLSLGSDSSRSSTSTTTSGSTTTSVSPVSSSAAHAGSGAAGGGGHDGHAGSLLAAATTSEGMVDHSHNQEGAKGHDACDAAGSGGGAERKSGED